MTKEDSRSKEIFARSSQVIPGGVNSPVRSFGSVGGTPFVVDHGEGAYLHDVDGNRYVDYVMSWGPLILGHAYPSVIKAIEKQVRRGTSYGAPTKAELELAELVCERMPWTEKLRLVSSGTEACMTAARVARGATGRNLIVKFDGGYHGHSDLFLVKAGSGLATGGLPASAGVPEHVTSTTLSIPYNNEETVKAAFAESGDKFAAVIVEPVAANMGVIPSTAGFLQTLRDLTAKHGALLIFDEVITGFRVAPGGAAELYGIRPDLVCLGKILGGGLPIGAVGGRADIMDHLAPVGNIYQAGTLSGNPLSVAAGIATLKALADKSIYDKIKSYAVELSNKLFNLFWEHDVAVQINRVESLFTIFFSEKTVTDFESAKKSDMKLYARFFHAILDQGIFLPPSGYEAWFVSAAHGEKELKQTVSAIAGFLEE
jgi:glutamate-1-semialdehyde 2,1-aminomutase